mmetsp:Transcript_122350/g.222556  ORF Transcript_122350/g.222556 Transcript_122350/m.222556 type:complete len:363 (-) Transcript_122350:9-1097(-)
MVINCPGAITAYLAVQVIWSRAAVLKDGDAGVPDSAVPSLLRREQQHVGTLPSLSEEHMPIAAETSKCSMLKNRKFVLSDPSCHGAVKASADELQVASDAVAAYWNRMGSTNPWMAEFAHKESAPARYTPTYLKHDFYSSGQEWLDLTLKIALEHNVHNIIPEDPSSARAVDFGCGLGRTSNPIAKLGFKETFCVDTSQTMIDAAKTELTTLQGSGEIMDDVLHHINFVRSGLDLSCTVETDSVDFLHSALTLQYMKPVVQIAYIEQFCDLLKIGGAGLVQIASAVFGDSGSRHCDLHEKAPADEEPARYHIPHTEASTHLLSRGCVIHGTFPIATFGQGGHAMLIAFKKTVSKLEDEGESA